MLALVGWYVSTDVFGKSAKTSASPIHFLTGPNAGNPIDIALAYIKAMRLSSVSRLRTSGDGRNRLVTDKDVGTTHISLRQTQAGIQVYNGNINVNVARERAIVDLGNSFVSNLAGAVSAAAPRLDAKQAVQAGAKALGLDLKQDLQVVKTAGGPSRAVVFNGAGISAAAHPGQARLRAHGRRRGRPSWPGT